MKWSESRQCTNNQLFKVVFPQKIVKLFNQMSRHMLTQIIIRLRIDRISITSRLFRIMQGAHLKVSMIILDVNSLRPSDAFMRQ